jgi:hypothetical protein
MPVDSLQFIISGVFTIIGYAMVLFAVYKVFQISTEVTEIKNLLQDIKRNTSAAPNPGSFPHSPESLVRAVHSASYSDLEAQLTEEPQQ